MPKTNNHIRKKIQKEIARCLKSLNRIHGLIENINQSHSKQSHSKVNQSEVNQSHSEEVFREKTVRKPKKIRRKLTDEGIEKIITSLKNRGVKFTKTNILNELSLFGFGKTDQNYKIICSKIEQIKSLFNS